MICVRYAACGNTFTIVFGEVIEDKEKPKVVRSIVAEMDGGVTVVLDTNLTDELIEEGFVRELISKVQTQRREAEFEVTDHILITLKTTDRLASVVSRGGAEILRAALADGLAIAEPEGFVREWSINGEAAIAVERANTLVSATMRYPSFISRASQLIVLRFSVPHFLAIAVFPFSVSDRFVAIVNAMLWLFLR